MSGIEEAFATDLSRLRDEAFSALETGRRSDLEEVLDSYFTLFEMILGAWHSYGLLAETLDDPLRPLEPYRLRMLTRDLHHIVEKAVQGDQHEMIGAAMYLPFRVMRLTLSPLERHLFQSLARIVTTAYIAVSRERAPRSRGFVVDRCGTYLREFAEFSLYPRMEHDATGPEDIDALGLLLAIVIETFSTLLKLAVNLRDASSFHGFGEAMDRLLQHYRPEFAVPGAYRLELESELGELSADQQRQLDRYRTLVSVGDRRRSLMQTVWFGIASWLVRLVREGSITGHDCSAMLQEARQHFTDLTELSALLPPMMAEGGLPAWENWVLGTLPEGKVHFIDTESWTRLFYVIQGLRLTPEHIGDEGTPVVADRQWEHILSSLTEDCDQVRSQRSTWLRIVTDEDIGRIDNFVELHRRAVEAAKSQYARWLIEQPISEPKWRDFRKGFLEAWHRSATIRGLTLRLGVFEDRTQEPTPAHIQRWGVHRLVDKRMLVDDPYVAYVVPGETFGMSMGSGENEHVLRLLAENLSRRHATGQWAIGDTLLAAVEGLEALGYEPNVVLINTRRVMPGRVSHPQFLPRWHPDCEPLDVVGFDGRLRGVPIVDVGFVLMERTVVADLRALGRFVQYCPNGNAGDVFDFELETIDEGKARRWLQDDPESFRKTLGDSPEEKAWTLQQQVVLSITQRFEFIIEDPGAAVIVVVSSEPNSPDSD